MKRKIEIVFAFSALAVGIGALIFVRPAVSKAKADTPVAVAPSPYKVTEVAPPLFERFPVSSGLAVSKFGEARMKRAHVGVDFGAVNGEDVVAVAAGRIKLYHNRKFACVMVIHEGIPGVRSTGYCELKIEVPDGAMVKAGQKIGTVEGKNGNFAQHMHFEVVDDKGEKIDPCQPRLMKCVYRSR